MSWDYNEGWDEEKVFFDDVKQWISNLQYELNENQFNEAKRTISGIQIAYHKLSTDGDLPVEIDYLCAKTAAAFRQYDLANQLLDDYFSRSQNGNTCWMEARRFKELMEESQEIIEKGEALPGFDQASEISWINGYAVYDMHELSKKIGGAMILKGESTVQIYCKPGSQQSVYDQLHFQTGGTEIFDYVEILEAKDEHELATLREKMQKQIISDNTTIELREITFQILE